MLVAGKLEALGMEVTKHSAQPHRPNVLGVLKGRDGAPSLILNDHLDTYPAVEPRNGTDGFRSVQGDAPRRSALCARHVRHARQPRGIVARGAGA